VSAIKQFLIDYGRYRALGYSPVECVDFAARKSNGRATVKHHNNLMARQTNDRSPERADLQVVK